MSNIEAGSAPAQTNRASTASIALGIAFVLLLQMYEAKFDPVADFLWIFMQADSVSGYFWQHLLADLLSISLLTLLAYAGLRRSGIDRRLRPSGIVHTLIGLTAALPVLWSAYLLWLGAKQNDLADIYSALHYDQRLMVEPMLFLCVMAMVMLVVANWVDIRLTVKRRRGSQDRGRPPGTSPQI